MRPWVPSTSGMAGVADEDDLALLAFVVLSFLVHLGDERTGGVDDRQTAFLGLVLHRLRDTVGAEHGDGVVGDLVQFLDEDRALGAERLDDAFVVDDLVADVDRRSVEIEGPFDNLDGPFHAGAEAARLGQDHPQVHLFRFAHVSYPRLSFIGQE